MSRIISADVVIFGGGAAGLWLLAELRRDGRNAILLEANHLGTGQTISSQGIIHGGFKYTLSGLFTPSAQAIKYMPAVWRNCLSGKSHPNLSRTIVRTDSCFIWSTGSLKSRFAMFGAKTFLSVAPQPIPNDDHPEILANCAGTVSRLDEQVIDPASLLADLTAQNESSILKIKSEHGISFKNDGERMQSIRLEHPNGGDELTIRPRIVVLAAGEGNASLRTQMSLDKNMMQRRPLHMVVVRGNLPRLNGHCVDGTSTRLTITTTTDSAGRTIWQVGGQLAESGVGKGREELLVHARSEIHSVFPNWSFQDCEWSTYQVDRAEPLTKSSNRPDDAFVAVEDTVITAWPTKLALVPELTRRLMVCIDTLLDSSRADGNVPDDWPRPVVAQPPWETETQWISAP